MTAAEKSFIGIAKQTAKAAPNTTDADFKYMLFRAGGVAPQNIVIPLDAEVGGGAMLRDMVKVGVTSGGALDLIPRPDTMGSLLYGALGKCYSNPNKLDDCLTKEDLPAAPAEAAGAKTSPPTPSYLAVTGYPEGATLTGDILCDGTDEEDKAITDLAFALDGDKTVYNSTKLFKTLTSVNLCKYVTLGDAVCVGYIDGAYKHLITLPSDQFDAPYWTLRSAPGSLWGESFQDCRVAGYALTFAGARFVEGAATFIGGLPVPAATTTWGALAKVDSGPQLLAPTSAGIEMPTATSLKVLSGSVALGLAIPLDEQWIIGSYSPDDFDINQRSMVISMAVKISDDTLYKKMMYDGVGAASAWTADLYKQSDLVLQLKSPTLINGIAGLPYRLDIRAHDTLENIIWSAAPIGLRAGRQIVMAVTGVVINTNTGNPIEFDLYNDTQSYSY